MILPKVQQTQMSHDILGGDDNNNPKIIDYSNEEVVIVGLEMSRQRPLFYSSLRYLVRDERILSLKRIKRDVNSIY